MWITVWSLLVLLLIGFSSISWAASPSSLQDNNKQFRRMLSKRNVYFQKVEELLSQVSILQLRVRHIQTELEEIKQDSLGGKDCADINASQLGGCNQDVLKELNAAIQNLQEELGLENTKSDAISKDFENLREQLEEYSYKVEDVEETCQTNSLKMTDSTYDIDNMNITIKEIESRLMEEVESIKSCMKATCGATKKRSIGPPSFISKWLHMKTSDSKLSRVIIEHGLNELPAKVDVQVRSVSGTDYDWIFPGASVSQGDDDTGEDYGGVIYFYNSTHVTLCVPVDSNNDGQGYVVTTGHRNDYFVGSHHYKYIEARVRVRIWLLDRFPKPAYMSQWHPLSILDAAKSFYTMRHGLSSYPALVVVQVKSLNMISEAAGSSLQFKVTARYSNGGGVVYGVDDRMVRIWAAYVSNTSYVGYGRLFGTGDGWSWMPGDSKSGDFRIIVWDSSSFDGRNFLLRESNVMEMETGALSMPAIDIDNDLVSFYVQSLDGPNQGFLFNGISNSAIRWSNIRLQQTG